MGLCRECGGLGWVEVDVDVFDRGCLRKQLLKNICPKCNGSGNDEKNNSDENDDRDNDESTI